MRSHRSLALALSIFTLAAFALIPGTAGAVTGAAFTTTNTTVDGTGHCKNGNENINCNIYDGKQFVWLNGGPTWPTSATAPTSSRSSPLAGRRTRTTARPRTCRTTSTPTPTGRSR